MEKVRVLRDLGEQREDKQLGFRRLGFWKVRPGGAEEDRKTLGILWGFLGVRAQELFVRFTPWGNCPE